MSERKSGPAEGEIEVAEEKVCTISFRRAWIAPMWRRAPRVSRMLRDYAKRIMKAEEVLISGEVNEAIWSKGSGNPPRKMRVRLVKDKEGKVIVYPA
ncbi:MAG: 50S ribosomal protein L31e [Candidatus Bathyarchaeia archaeon]